MRLIIAGGGSAEQSKEVDRFFLDQFDNSKPMIYIPIAISFGERHSPESVYDWIMSTFSNLGYKNIDMLIDLDSINYEALSKYGAVYIGGGNTFKLLKDFKESGFYSLLLKYLQDDIGPVYGGSAGAILFGATISTARLGEQIDPLIEGFNDFDSYDVLHGIDFDVHYLPRHDEEVKDYVKNSGRNVISIPEESALFVKIYEKREYEAIGSEPIFLFTKDSKNQI